MHYGTHSIIANDDKKDGASEVFSKHLIYSCISLSVYVSLLFTTMLRHGLTPDGMLNGTMVPIPKRRQANLSSSDYFRAITLRSMLYKLLDVIILTKEEAHLCTSNLQFGFKQGSSTSLCTAMVQEIISYYAHNGSNVYSLILDASKAFDCVNYCNLFRILLERKLCPLYYRLLLNMYTNQKLRVRWKSISSPYFNVSNYIKQVGVISPILFCIYMDQLLYELGNSGVGCYMDGVCAVMQMI